MRCARIWERVSSMRAFVTSGGGGAPDRIERADAISIRIPIEGVVKKTDATA
jgi:hypothetical protein